MVEYTFRRYVNGTEMAEGVKITQAETLDEAIRKAVAMCTVRGTVLFLENARAEAAERQVAMLREALKHIADVDRGMYSGQIAIAALAKAKG